MGDQWLPDRLSHRYDDLCTTNVVAALLKPSAGPHLTIEQIGNAMPPPDSFVQCLAWPCVAQHLPDGAASA